MYFYSKLRIVSRKLLLPSIFHPMRAEKSGVPSFMNVVSVFSDG